MRRATVLGVGAAGSVALIRRMRRELLEDGRLSRLSVVAIYGGYLTHGALVLDAARRRNLPLPLPRRPALVGGVASVIAGAVTYTAGIRRFSGPAHASGTEPGDLVTTGIYRYSRNP